MAPTRKTTETFFPYSFVEMRQQIISMMCSETIDDIEEKRDFDVLVFYGCVGKRVILSLKKKKCRKSFHVLAFR
jgi:hypothetical protein